MTRPIEAAGDWSDGEIDQWWFAWTATGLDDQNISDLLIHKLSAAYERILFHQDQLEQHNCQSNPPSRSEKFQMSRCISAFDRTPYSSGRRELNAFQNYLRVILYHAMHERWPYPRRVRNVYKHYRDRVSGRWERAQQLAMAIVSATSSMVVRRNIVEARRASARYRVGTRWIGAIPEYEILDEILGKRPANSPGTVARALVRRLAGAGKQVVVNLGGTGEAHEPIDGINVNKNEGTNARTYIPNVVQDLGENIGSLFEPNSVDGLEGHNLAWNWDWNRVATGASKVLKPGAPVKIYFRGASPEGMKKMVDAFKRAGFVNVVDVPLPSTKEGGGFMMTARK